MLGPHLKIEELKQNEEDFGVHFTKHIQGEPYRGGQGKARSPQARIRVN